MVLLALRTQLNTEKPINKGYLHLFGIRSSVLGIFLNSFLSFILFPWPVSSLGLTCILGSFCWPPQSPSQDARHDPSTQYVLARVIFLITLEVHANNTHILHFTKEETEAHRNK